MKTIEPLRCVMKAYDKLLPHFAWTEIANAIPALGFVING
jgi:hypothetical protein